MLPACEGMASRELSSASTSCFESSTRNLIRYCTGFRMGVFQHLLGCRARLRRACRVTSGVAAAVTHCDDRRPNAAHGRDHPMGSPATGCHSCRAGAGIARPRQPQGDSPGCHFGASNVGMVHRSDTCIEGRAQVARSCRWRAEMTRPSRRRRRGSCREAVRTEGGEGDATRTQARRCWYR